MFIGTDILSIEEAREWLRVDDEDTTLQDLILVTFDYIDDAVDNLQEKLSSDKVKRKVKLCMLNLVAEMYDNRGAVGKDNERLKFIVSSMMMQLQYA